MELREDPLYPEHRRHLSLGSLHQQRQLGCHSRLVLVVLSGSLSQMLHPLLGKGIEVNLAYARGSRAVRTNLCVLCSELGGLRLLSRWSRWCVSTHLDIRVSQRHLQLIDAYCRSIDPYVVLDKLARRA